MPSNLSNPFLPEILPHHKTDFKKNAEAMEGLAGVNDPRVLAYRELTGGTVYKPPQQEPTFEELEAEADEFIKLEQSAQRNIIGRFFEEQIPVQYKQQIKALSELQLLKSNPETGLFGITAIDNKFYPIPTIEQITTYFTNPNTPEKTAFFARKVEQGFTQLEITPIGLPLKAFETTMTSTILQHHVAGTLKNKNGEVLDCDTKKPFKDWCDWSQKEQDGTLVYFPQQFDKVNHGGKTKQQLLTDPTQPFPGYLIRLVKPDNVIPRQGKATPAQGGRIDLEANQTPNDYLEQLTNPTSPYFGEYGYTLEQWYTKFLTTLHTKNIVIDDYDNKEDSICFTIGNFNTASGGLPYASGVRGYCQADVYGGVPWFSDEDSGARCAVG